MITDLDILGLGFSRVPEWDTEVTLAYKYEKNRYDKPRNTINLYRLDRLVDTDYMELKSTLQRETDFVFPTYSFNGELETIDDLFELFESFREHNRHI
jgi:hypothetical protein